MSSSRRASSDPLEPGEIVVRSLGADDRAVLDDVAPEVFDEALRAEWTDEFLADPRHHIVVAVAGSQVVGFVSGVHYVHPDKAPELFVNELGVTPSHRRRGIATRLFSSLLAEARRHGCCAAWVPTEADNDLARAFYESLAGHGGPEPVVHYSFPLAEER
jgi:aminoglycoside 6'-N-acetyltransferase I